MEQNHVITDRLLKLRNKMKQDGIDWCYIPTGDFHNSEYVSDYFTIREFFSGFTGSNGTLLISADFAGLWTDGRYFIQAEQELKGTSIELFRMLDEGVPTINEYLESQIKKDQTLGFDGRVVPATMGEEIEKAVKKCTAFMNVEFDPAEMIWTVENGRSEMPCNPVRALSSDLTGMDCLEKIELVRAEMEKQNAKYHFISKLDDLMWLFNIRGNDVECNPVALCHALLSKEEAIVFIQKKALGTEMFEYFSSRKIEVYDYFEAAEVIKEKVTDGNILIDKKNISTKFHHILNEKCVVTNISNPTEMMKAVKNRTEIEKLRDVYLKDSVAVTKFIYEMKNAIDHKNYTEYEAAMRMDQIRMEIPECYDLSFPTICGYQANAAMMHYQAAEDRCAQVHAEGMLLVDSGGQFEGGTTDVTRTISMGEVTKKQKDHYTRVCRGMLNLSAVKFLYGCTGRNLDIIARQPMWETGMDYKCGTGHGIGYMLNVHEGPQSIRWQYVKTNVETVLEEGMIVSNEPGIYLDGEYGIRIENIMLCKKAEKNSDGQFMEFETLTYVPLDRAAVVSEMMSDIERERLNQYQANVYEKVSPYLTETEREWLYMETRPVS
ncbi:MAG: aminopeptidase P family protein [Lachnospiraceae bacterium]|nr:aminopeptidase P family protein [Lachnospiraceae bacterium]